MKACSIIPEDPDVVEFLLDQGIEVNRRDAFGQTALGQSEVIKVLLDRPG